MSLEAAIAFFFVVFIFGITPGPGSFALISRALILGGKSCLSVSLGMATSGVIYLVFACFGLSTLATNWEVAFTLIRILGALYLMYLGGKMWRSPISINTTESDTSANTSLRTGTNIAKGFLQGIVISATNPKVIFFYIAFLPSFMDVEALPVADVILSSAITFSALLLALLLIVIGASKARELFHSEYSLSALNKTAGTMMFGAGGIMIVRS